MSFQVSKVYVHAVFTKYVSRYSIASLVEADVRALKSDFQNSTGEWLSYSAGGIEYKLQSRRKDEK
jgi:hypothetical protein